MSEERNLQWPSSHKSLESVLSAWNGYIHICGCGSEKGSHFCSLHLGLLQSLLQGSPNPLAATETDMLENELGKGGDVVCGTGA